MILLELGRNGVVEHIAKLFVATGPVEDGEEREVGRTHVEQSDGELLEHLGQVVVAEKGRD